MRAHRGAFTYEDHGTPWSTVARNLEVIVTRPTSEYRGQAKFSNGTVAVQQYVPMRADMSTTFRIIDGHILLDRIDLNIEVPAVTASDLILPPPAEGSKEVAARVVQARAIQMARYEALGLSDVRTNATAPAPILEEIAKPDAAGMKLLRDAADAMQLSARGYHRVLRVARTLADLDRAAPPSA